MKFLVPISLFALSFAASAGEAQKTKPVFRDAATHEQLSRALRVSEQKDPMKNLVQSEGVDPTKVNLPVDLLEQSDIICFRGLATIVPKRAILSSPSNHKKTLGMQPGSKFVGWADFYAQNRAWITTVEVDRTQAQGRKEIAEATRKRIGKTKNLVVATMMGGPISVNPFKDPEVETGAETAQTKP